jgi:iron complex transport system substrate-binding protein
MKSSNHITAIRIITALLIGMIIVACQPVTEDSNSVLGRLATSENIISVTDFTGAELVFSEPVESIVALSPHIVENIYVVGASDRLSGVVEYSNFPPQATELPIVASFEKTNIERIVELNPDLIMAWESGNSHSAINRLKELGCRLYMDRPDSLGDVAKSIRDIGALTGLSDNADAVASNYESALEQFSKANQDKAQVSVFYQVWNSPLQTISGNHIISASIELCGGTNIYADEFSVAPIINIESVLERDPQVIIASGMGDDRPQWLDDWARWPNLRAVQGNNLFAVNPDYIQRHTTRLLLGIEAICQRLDEVRKKND